MYSIISTNRKQVLVWAIMFVLVLSVFPTTVADEADDEWFYDIYETVTDEDGDGSDDTIDIGYDPDTDCDCNISITVYIDIYDEDGYVEYIYAEHTINNGYYDWFSQDWTTEYSGTFDFHVYMYDEWGNYEDYWNVTGIELEPMTGSTDETINVDNGVFNEDDDSLMNDLAFWAHIKSDGEDYVNITVWKKNAVGQWDYYDDGSTDDDGFLTFKNATGGEYLWDAYHDGNHLSDEGGYAVVDNIYTTGHVGVLQDWDNADDWDDFVVQIPEGNGTSDEGYVEIYDEDDNLVDSGKTDENEGDDRYAFVSYDLEKGNYTHYIYEEENGDLLQNGSFYSYGSTSTNYDEWFEDWDYETEDTNGDGVANSLTAYYDPDTECNCTIDIEVEMYVFNNDTGDYADSDYESYEINGTEDDWFETAEWSADRDANYTFEFYLYDDNWNYEDHFNFTVYLECDDDNNNSDDCDNDEWFEDWDYDTESTDGDNLVDTINVDYDPDTDCDCDVGVYVYMEVYENASGNWVDYTDSQYHEINGTEEEYFTHSWTSANSTSYDFYVYMYDDNWHFEDSFWVYNVYLYQKSGAGGPGDEDEYFDWIYEYVWDDDDDGYNDTVELDYDPDTTCECDINITLYIDVYDNETGAWVNGTEEDYTIYHDDDDYWYQEWSPEYNGTFDFFVELYDEDGNLEEEVEYLDVDLHVRSSGGGGDGDDDEWFYDWDYDVNPSDTINIGYDPDTECDCYVNITVFVDVYESDTGDYIDYIYAEHTIYNGEGDWFVQDWTASNDGTYDFYVSLYDEDWNDEDDFWIYNVSLESDGGGGGNGSDDDEWFYDWDYDVNPSDTITIGYDPDTECDCNVTVTVNVDVYESDTGDYIDYVYAEHTIYNGHGDWFTQDWTSWNDDYYDFHVSMYDEDWNEEDDFWIYDVYLSSDGGGGGNGSDDGVGHVGFIEEWDDDGYVNDYIGFVVIEDYYKEDAYFEIYQDGELVDSGHAVNEWFVSGDLSEGWYEHKVYYEENGPVLQEGPFYSYGNSSNPETSDIVNVDNAVIDNDEPYIYDDVGFIAHRGNLSNGEEGVEITVYVWNEEEEAWYDHAYLITDDIGEAWLYNETCGQYQWDSSASSEAGYYEVWTGCDSSGGGGNQTEDYDEWIHAWMYYVPQDENGNNNWNEIVVGYDPDTDCDCDVEVYVVIEVYDENGNLAADSQSSHTINGTHEDWFLQEISMNIEPGNYDFFLTMYDEHGNHEEEKSFSLIMSDEWLDYDWTVEEDSNVKIDLQGNTNYDGEIHTYYEANVYRWNENENDWEKIDELAENATISSGEENSASIHFEWEAEESGDYRFVVYMYDGMGQEDSFDFEINIVLNQAPIIESIIYDSLIFEGWESKFEVEAFDDDHLEITWHMGDGSTYYGESIWHVYSDNSDCGQGNICYATVEVFDGEFTVIEDFAIEVNNVAPKIEMLDYDNNEGTGIFTEGSQISFVAQVTDVASDQVSVQWSFPDGSVEKGTFAQYTFADDGQYVVLFTADDGEDGGRVEQQLVVTINNAAPVITECTINGIDCDALSSGIDTINVQEETEMDFKFSATDPGDDTITYTFNFGDGTSPTTNENGETTHKFADGEDFTVVMCAQDDDGAVSQPCKTVIIPVSVIEQLEDEGLLEGLPGFGLLGVLSALGVIGILRRKTH